MYTVPLRLAGREPVHKIGSKAMQLARLTEVNIAIPDGFVLTSDAFKYHIVENGLRIDNDYDEFIVRFKQAEFSVDVTREVTAAYATLQEQNTNIAVAVRSSSMAEDLQEASFAGQYETILNVTELPQLFKSIMRCWASYFSPQIQQYAQQKNIDLALQEMSMSVLIQQMVQADVSGVIFSMNPVTGRTDEIVINASYGLGESIVVGLVIPDTYYVNKYDGSFDKELGAKDLKIVAAPYETMQMETTLEEQNSFCLSDEKITQLIQYTHQIEAFFGRAVDIEFALKDDIIYILQARPVTTTI